MLAAIWRIASITIPLPVALLVSLGVWWQVDKNSAVRKAVAELVASSELEAERAKVRSADLVRAEVEKQRDTLAAANKEFELDAEAARKGIGEAEQTIANLLKRPVDPKCSVDDDLLGRLRAK